MKTVYFALALLLSSGHCHSQAVPKALSERLSELSQRPATTALVREAMPTVAVPDAPPLSFFKDNKDTVLGELTNHQVKYGIFHQDQSGTLTLLPSLVSASNKLIAVRSEQSSFKYIGSGNDKQRYGFSIAISADLTITKGEVNLSNLFAVGVAAKANRVSGTLTVQVTGLSGEPILNSLPSTSSSISEESIQKALETVAIIRAKIYDEKVTVIPQVLE